MYTYTFSNRFGTKFVAILSVLSLFVGMVPMQVFAQEVLPEAPAVVEPVVTVEPTPEVVPSQDQTLLMQAPMTLLRGSNPPPSPAKVDICHMSGQSGNYQPLNVDQSSVISNGNGGHGNHSGDIIPPFTGFAGRNWDAYGQLIFNNKCVDPAPFVDINPVVVEQCGPQEITVSGTAHLHTANVVDSQRHLFVWSDTVEKIHETLTGKNVHQNYDWSFTEMYGVGTHTVKAENKQLLPTVEVIDSALVEFTIDACPVETEMIQLCKYESAEGDADPIPLAGWVMNLTNDKDGEGEVTFSGLVTNENGCVTQEVNPADGPFFAEEVMQRGWQQDEVFVTGGTLTNYDTTCEFFGESVMSKVSTKPVFRCSFYNSEIPDGTPVCEIGSNLLENGSFETPTVASGDWGIFTSVANWLISLSDGLELWTNGFYGGASDGAQNAELDGNSPTKITQSVATVPGATYELRFDFSARPDSDSAANNSVDAWAGDVMLMNVTADGTDITTNTWSTHTKTFVATTTTTDISFVDKGVADSYGSLIDNAVLCYVSDPAPVCEPELNGSWADEVTFFEQGDRKDGSPVLAARSDEADALGAADWTAGEAVDFLSLGFGGSIVFTFGPFIPDVLGNDITIYEATNGTYPAETVLVEVSQDATTWYPLGTATNPGASSFDFSSTSLSWVKYVRLTDTSNPALHTNDADGFDLDAVFVAQTVCTQPEDPVEPAPTCALTIVSDVTNTVVEREDDAAKLISYPWTAVVNLANWIWADETVQSPTADETYTFEKSFVWNGPITSAVLNIAADNSYEVRLNGELIGSSTDENNHAVETQDQYTGFAAEVLPGDNTLAVTVKNWAQPNGTAETNPAGLLYNLTILDTESEECDTTPNGETYRLQGFVWHDDDKNREWNRHNGIEDEVILDELPLEGWTVRATNGVTNLVTTSDREGYYKFDVPAGVWTITEEVAAGWERTTQESYTVTVPAETANATVLDMVLAYVMPTAQAEAMYPTYGDYDFGNDIVDTPSTSRSGGGSGTRVLSRVAGDSISTVEPTPMVLGEQVSAVPFGAPSTGHGGTAQTNSVNSLSQLLVSPRHFQVVE